MIEDFDGEDALVIERYDRDGRMPQGRIHQEDMNQVLGASGNQKYQEYGGRVSLKRMAEVFTRRGDIDSVNRLVSLVTLAVAVGNLDMHAKNVSILHDVDGSSTLAPAYDMVPQRHQRNDGRVALAVDGEYRHALITFDHIAREARSWGIQHPIDAVTATLDAIIVATETERPHPLAYPRLAEDIGRFARNLLAGEPAG